jgi:hypothetical protein
VSSRFFFQWVAPFFTEISKSRCKKEYSN